MSRTEHTLRELWPGRYALRDKSGIRLPVHVLHSSMPISRGRFSNVKNGRATTARGRASYAAMSGNRPAYDTIEVAAARLNAAARSRLVPRGPQRGRRRKGPAFPRWAGRALRDVPTAGLRDKLADAMAGSAPARHLKACGRLLTRSTFRPFSMRRTAWPCSTIPDVTPGAQLGEAGSFRSLMHRVRGRSCGAAGTAQRGRRCWTVRLATTRIAGPAPNWAARMGVRRCATRTAARSGWPLTSDRFVSCSGMHGRLHRRSVLLLSLSERPPRSRQQAALDRNFQSFATFIKQPGRGAVADRLSVVCHSSVVDDGAVDTWPISSAPGCWPTFYSGPAGTPDARRTGHILRCSRTRTSIPCPAHPRRSRTVAWRLEPCHRLNTQA